MAATDPTTATAPQVETGVDPLDGAPKIFVNPDEQFAPSSELVIPNPEAAQVAGIQAELEQLKPQLVDTQPERPSDFSNTDAGVQHAAQAAQPTQVQNTQPLPVNSAQVRFEKALKDAPGYRPSDDVINAAERFAQGSPPDAKTSAALRARNMWERTLRLAA